jgi:hypothetical protein
MDPQEHSLQLQILPHSNSFRNSVSIIELLMNSLEVHDCLLLSWFVLASELFFLLLFFLLPRSEGQKVAIIVGIWFPKNSQERGLKLLPPVLPVRVDHLDELLAVVHVQYERVLLFNHCPEALI